MLTIRTAQLPPFGLNIRNEFIEILSRYVRQRWPHVAGAEGSFDVVREFVSTSVDRGIAWGFRDRGHLTTWVDWEAEFGPAFYLAESWTWCHDLLQSGPDPAVRLHRISNRLVLLRERGEQ